jgi:uncharacterized HAD superfamily protein
MKIGIDIDNVLAHTFRDLSAYFNRFMGKEMDPLEVVNTIRNDRFKMLGYWFSTWKNRLLTTVAPIEGAAETIGHWAADHRIALVTSRLPLFNRQTREWLARHGFLYHELHHAREKTKHKKAKGCDIFVEDNLDESEILADHCGQVFLMDHPWNRRPTEKKNIIRVHNWSEIRTLLNQWLTSK